MYSGLGVGGQSVERKVEQRLCLHLSGSQRGLWASRAQGTPGPVGKAVSQGNGCHAPHLCPSCVPHPVLSSFILHQRPCWVFALTGGPSWQKSCLGIQPNLLLSPRLQPSLSSRKFSLGLCCQQWRRVGQGRHRVGQKPQALFLSQAGGGANLARAYGLAATWC